MLIDTHCHLNFQAFEEDVDKVVASAKKASVEKIINVGADLISSQKAVSLAQNHDRCYAAVGFHPHHADKLAKDWKEELKKLAQQPKVIAIGECGLDYHDYRRNGIVNPKIQKEVFQKQIRFAQDLNLPLIIHSRQAFNDVISFLGQFLSRSSLTGVFHCYSAGRADIEKVSQLGFYFGFDGNLTYDVGLQKVVEEIPLEKIVLETDAPFLSPFPFRNQRNEPKNVRIVCEFLAKIKNISQEEVARITSQNAQLLFHF